MPWYKKRPVTIEAHRWMGGAENATPIIEWVLQHGGTARYHEYQPPFTSEDGMTGSTEVEEHLQIDTLEGTMTGSVGDYIIRGVQGEFYPCKPNIFEESYEVADAPS